ncbi:MAG: hypothetical protein IPH75_11585 [bacterium]|nr:hypothetical protein [bacterium]
MGRISTHSRFGGPFRHCLLGILLLLATSAMAGNEVDTRIALSDLRVLYLYDDPQSIDWASLYYLNDWYGARIDLVTVRPGDIFLARQSGLDDRQLYLHTYSLPDSGQYVDSILFDLSAYRYPDIILIGDLSANKQAESLAVQLIQAPYDSVRLFNISKIYREVDSLGRSMGVSINARELANRYRDRMVQEIPTLYPGFDFKQSGSEALLHYELLANRLDAGAAKGDFLSGLGTNRLGSIVGRRLSDGAIKESLSKRIKTYFSMISLSTGSYGKKRAEHMLTGLQELRTFQQQAKSEARLQETAGFAEYLDDQVGKLQELALDEIGLRWEGRIVVRESPDGPRVKFIATLASDGPTEIELNELRFEPYWDSTVVILDGESKKVQPHQTFVREYLVEVDREKLEAQQPESLLFSASLAYGKMPFAVSSSVPIWEAPDLDVSFLPSFLFIPPVPALNVDKVVDSRTWKALITKPPHFYGAVRLQLETPRGMFAGAYLTERQMLKGELSEVVRIPFTISNLFELGTQSVTLSLHANNKVVATDTAHIRIASCEIDDKIKIGFLPDTTGLLEDILRMTGAGFQPITDRSLAASDLDMYNVIVVGSGSSRDYPSLRNMRDRLTDFVRHGGSLIILGQPTDWPESALPVGFVPASEKLSGRDILNRIPGANMLSKPYAISDRGLLDQLERKQMLSAAVVTPAENIFVTPSGASLLSVSRLGDGQVIYCGLPLLEMVGQLNIEAIHLLANILNY